MTIEHFPIVTYDQPAATFYAATIPAKKLVRRVEIRRRSESQTIGIQRDDDLSRIGAIARYLATDDAIVPTPIVLSCSSELVIVEGNEVCIDSELRPVGHVLDGQHRVLGLAQLGDEELERFNLLVVFVFDIDAYSDASIFSTINSNQRQVSKSLIYDLFGLNPHGGLIKTCHEICKSLNDDIESPFYRRLKMLGRKVGDTETLSQAAFIDHLVTAIQQANSPLGGLLRRDGEWAIRKIMDNAFRAVLQALENTGANYPHDYFLKTTGYGGIMKAMPALVERGQQSGSLEMSFFEPIFEKYFSAHPEPTPGTGNSKMIEIRKNLLAVF